MRTLGFLKDGDYFTTISVPESRDTLAYGISNNGVVAGTYLNSQGYWGGFIYNGLSYTTLDYPIYDINNSGWMVAGSLLYNGVSYIPIDLAGASEVHAYSINDNNQIGGLYKDSSGYHGFVATMVPIPSAAWLLGSGLIGLVVIRRRMKK